MLKEKDIVNLFFLVLPPPISLFSYVEINRAYKVYLYMYLNLNLEWLYYLTPTKLQFIIFFICMKYFKNNYLNFKRSDTETQ